MNQYNLIYPENNKIYYGTNPKSVATKVFRNLAKNKDTQQSRIIIQDNNSKKTHHFVAMTNKKLNKYADIVNNLNTNQVGGSLPMGSAEVPMTNNSEKIDDKEFFKKLSELSGNINLSVDELVKILKTKYDPESESEKEAENVVTIVNDGIEKLDTLNENVANISADLAALRNEIAPAPEVIREKIIINNGTAVSVVEEDSEDGGGFCTIM
jgi:hypothetical protein